MHTQIQKLAAKVSVFIAASQQSNARFEELALELFAFQFQFNLPYSKYCQSIGRTPSNVSSWQQIPAIVTSAFKELDLTIFRPEERAAVFHSSGTTQQKPSRHIHGKQTLALYELSLLTWFKPHFDLHRGKRRFLFLTPPPKQAPHSSLVHMFSTLGCDLAGEYTFASHPDEHGAWVVNPDSVTEFLRGRTEPVIVAGTAFSFVHLYDALGSAGLPLPPGSKIMETGGYKGRSRVVNQQELHRMISEIFAISPAGIVCEYGMSELSSQAYSHSILDHSPQKFLFPPWARRVVISPETGKEVGEGESGLLRIFDLANVGSVMAIQTEDIAVQRGDGFELLGRARASEARGCSLMAA